jgi:hypothetical protein
VPLSINFNSKYRVPRILKEKYEYVPFKYTVYQLTMSDGSTVTLDIRKQLTDAWNYLEGHCARSKGCNEYFSRLAGKKTLAEWMKHTDFVIHLLSPRARNARTGKEYKQEDLPQANSAGSDIGFSLYTFLDNRQDTPALAAVLLHEIAHCAGATTNASAPNSLEAENALLPCGLGKYFQRDARG